MKKGSSHSSVLLAILGAAGAWIGPGQRAGAGPSRFNGPAFMGARGVVDVSIDAPRGSAFGTAGDLRAGRQADYAGDPVRRRAPS